MHYLIDLLNQYSYIVLFASLALELIAFPTPGEALMTYCGFLVFQGKMNWGLSILTAGLGASVGITVSYFIGGLLGETFFEKHGHYVHLGPKNLKSISRWFEKHGDKLLIIAFFITGVRHITGYFSGITKISFKRFAVNAYLGAFIWAGTFISLGKILGPDWKVFRGPIKKYIIIGSVIVALVIVIFYLYRNYKLKVKGFVVKQIDNSMKIFHSLGKIKALVICTAIAFLGLTALAAGFIHDYLAKEFNQFDNVVIFLVRKTFTGDEWSYIMGIPRFFTTAATLIIFTLIILGWIIVKGHNRMLEIRFLIITILGGEIFAKGLKLVFHNMGPSGLSLVGRIKYTFPAEQSLIAIVAYGFAAFIIIRYIKKAWQRILTVISVIIICILVGLSFIYLNICYPSDITAGYTFGGIWLSLNIVLLEVFRILPKIK